MHNNGNNLIFSFVIWKNKPICYSISILRLWREIVNICYSVYLFISRCCKWFTGSILHWPWPLKLCDVSVNIAGARTYRTLHVFSQSPTSTDTVEICLTSYRQVHTTKMEFTGNLSIYLDDVRSESELFLLPWQRVSTAHYTSEQTIEYTKTKLSPRVGSWYLPGEISAAFPVSLGRRRLLCY